MSLITLWHGKLDIPALPRRRVNVGNNAVEQTPFLGATISANIKISDVAGHDLIETNLAAPFDRLLIRRKGARRVDGSMAVLIGDGTAPEEFPPAVQLAWDKANELADYASSPEAVTRSWSGTFQFATEDEEAGIAGLRAPQIGALHAISARFAVGSQFEPATVVLPTGTGKTETMLATLVYRRLRRTLVLVPSVPLRSQIAGKFLSLGVLPDAGIVPQEVARPRVAALSAGLRTVEEAETLLREANVVVALPNTLEACEPEARQVLLEGCTDLMVDVGGVRWSRPTSKIACVRISKARNIQLHCRKAESNKAYMNENVGESVGERLRCI